MKCVLMSCTCFDGDYAFNEMKKFIKPNMKVVCIPFASDLQWLLSGNKKEYLERHYSPFANFGIEKKNFYLAKVTDGHKFLKEKLKRADIIYFSGGYMENIRFHLQNMRLWDFMKGLKNRKIFMGESAGALILLDNYFAVPHIESHYDTYRKEEGLGIVNNLDLIVHYDNNNELHAKNAKVLPLMSNRDNLVCLADGGIVIMDDNGVKYLGEYYNN